MLAKWVQTSKMQVLNTDLVSSNEERAKERATNALF